MTALASLVLALLLDRYAGEYPARWHPVVWMGRVIGLVEARAPRQPAAQLLYGAAMALLIPAAFAGAAWMILRIPGLDLVAGALLLKSTFAVRALGEAVRRVAERVEAGDLPGAREGLRSLCSRDPSVLSGEELLAGAVESAAENASDSAVAPLLWFVILGVPGAIFYRAVNTLDSMIGYRGRYERLGKASARLDDLLNLIPARLTAVLLLIVGALSGLPARRGWQIMWRDARRTESPNAGWPMAAMAGLLGVRLEKQGCYRLGDPLRPLWPADARRAWSIVARAAALTAVLASFAVVYLQWEDVCSSLSAVAPDPARARWRCGGP